METSAAGPALSSATRKDLQLGRRLFHVANGVAIAGAYALLFTYTQVVRFFGIIACLVYIIDRIRLHYPELVQRLTRVNALFFRAEEQFKESAMIPYVIAILLTILTFPKLVAIIAILTLAIADPLSAIVGITWGRRRIVPDKSVEGSLAFFVATVAVAGGTLWATTEVGVWPLLGSAFLIALAAAILEMLPLRIDDNLTIPLFVGFVAWVAFSLFGVPID